MIDRNINIDSSLQLSRRVYKEKGFEVTTKLVKEVMTKEMDMSFRKITKIALQANSVNNLFLRQRFAIKWLSITSKKTIFINIDETWLDMSDFRRMKWRPKYSTNSNPVVMI